MKTKESDALGPGKVVWIQPCYNKNRIYVCNLMENIPVRHHSPYIMWTVWFLRLLFLIIFSKVTEIKAILTIANTAITFRISTVTKSDSNTPILNILEIQSVLKHLEYSQLCTCIQSSSHQAQLAFRKYEFRHSLVQIIQLWCIHAHMLKHPTYFHPASQRN